ncbi:hypothetical protein HY768_11520 [candidate division TA06 bacterium]|uniref:Uncharacterized protein n=1 Tax=candidate division TA06 bacterium TaxID=2250710 RepID=A0A933IEB2_UNCT6|nr:hypothetical protein [candidate division TA06 bacterium]
MRARVLIVSILVFLTTVPSIIWGFKIEHSVIIEYNQYRNDFDMNPGFAFGYRLITKIPIINRIGLQFTYSKLPYFRGQEPYVYSPAPYRDQITWYGPAVIKPFAITLGKIEWETAIGIGLAHQSTWHDDLNQDESSLWGLGDYYTPTLTYYTPQFSTEISIKFFREQLGFGFGGGIRQFAGATTGAWTDIHNPPRLGFGYGLLFRLWGYI